ncbi:hypothetical protein GWI33_005457 [Rhynchophorus ferrugineus]|uniref:BPTI/Kunitz inhibitor domain-containing protein n=1 Tax=Rhynchophorus ferrugineus TaxID=354439 RepID=A0A834IVY7_RHYFE|nr:hypothetical protein GWI33_005457 [Rhynchophorus ferrugineus]
MRLLIVLFWICGSVWIEALPDISAGSSNYDIIDCYMPTELGIMRCRGLAFVFRWDNNSKKCVLDGYGGCKTTKNNFRSKNECERVARPVCEYLKKDDILDESVLKRI